MKKIGTEHRYWTARLPLACTLIGLCSLVGSTATFGGQTHAGHLSGVVAMDVIAHGTTVDLLTTVTDGAEMALRHQRSIDGGRTWGPLQAVDLGDTPIAVAKRGNDPQVVAYENHVVAQWSTAGGSRHGAGPMATAVSHDGGHSWAPGPNPADDGSTLGQNFSDLIADAEGTFYAAWIMSRESMDGRALGVARSTDFGETWEHRQVVDTGACECCWNKLVAPDVGAVRVLYRDHGIRDMALASTEDGGKTWARRGVVGAFNWDFAGCPHVGGGLAVTRDGDRLHALVWTGHEEQRGLYWVRSTDDGTSWSEPTRIGGELAHHADLGGAGSRLVAAWDEKRVIWVSTSDDDGNTWDQPQRLSTAEVAASHPLVVHAAGHFTVFWTERTEDGLLRWRSEALDRTDTPSSGQLE